MWGLLAAMLVNVAPTSAKAPDAPVVAQANGLVAEGKTDRAITLLQAAVAKSPNDAAAHDLLGGLLNRGGRYREALPHVHAAAELKPEEARFRYNRGIVLAEHGRFAEALADFDFALAKLPGEAAIYLERGAARLALGRRVEARQDWAAARRLSPSLIWTDWYEGTHDLIDGNSDSAIPKLGRVALLQPGFDAAQTWLVAAYLIEGMPYSPKAVSDPWVRALLDFHAGRRSFAALLAMAGGDQTSGDRRRTGEAWLHHGLRLQREGLLADARSAFTQAVEADAPRHAWKLLAEGQMSRQPPQPAQPSCAGAAEPPGVTLD